MLTSEILIERQRVLAKFGEYALRSSNLQDVLDEACRLVCEALGTDLSKILEMQPDGTSLLIRAGVGWQSGIVGVMRLKMDERSSETYAIEQAVPVVTQDIAKETRFVLPEFLRDHNVVSLVNVPIFVADGEPAYGLLQVDNCVVREFGEEDIQFLRCYASILGPVIDRLHKRLELKFVLNELAHRMKNQLAVIQAMASQTAHSAGSLKPFQELFEQRLQGLAVATDLLIGHGGSGAHRGAQLRELIKRQLKPFIPAADRLVCDGPNISITPDATQAIGLALHELATNAVKHGAWSGSKGRVQVKWQLLNTGALGNGLRLTWLEQEGPAVAAPTRRGFGHVVVESMVAKRVSGTAELVFAPKGVRWTLTMPMVPIDAAAAEARR